MPLEKHNISFPYARGLDEKTSDKTTAVGALDACSNIQFDKSGEIKKRFGFTRQARDVPLDSAALSAGVNAVAYKDEIVVFDGKNAYARNADGDLVDRGMVANVELKHEYVSRHVNANQSNAHVAIANGVAVYAWAEYHENVGSTQYHVITEVRDATTDTVLVPRYLIASQTIDTTSANRFYHHPQPQAVAVDNRVVVLYSQVVGSNGKITYATIDCRNGVHTDLVWAAVRDLVTDGNIATPMFSADYMISPTVTGGAVVVHYYVGDDSDASPSNHVIWKVTQHTINTSGVLSSAVSTFVVADTKPVMKTYAVSATEYYPVVTMPYVKGITTTNASGVPTSDATNQVFIAYNFTDSGNRELRFKLIAHDFATSVTADFADTTTCVLTSIGVANISSSDVEVCYTGHYVTDGGLRGTVGYGLSIANNYGLFHTSMDRSSGVGLTPQRSSWNTDVVGDGIVYDGRAYFPVVHQNGISHAKDVSNAAMFLIATDDATTTDGLAKYRIMATTAIASVPRSQTSDHMFRSAHNHRFQYGTQRVTALSASKFIFGASRFTEIGDLDNRPLFATSRAIIDFDPGKPIPAVEANGCLYSGGGMLHQYANDYFKENGFLTFPVPTSGTGSGTEDASGLLTKGSVYNYVAVFEYTDKSGNIQRSLPSRNILVTTGATSNNHYVDLDFYVLQWTNKIDPKETASSTGSTYRLVLYRTVAGGGVYYRCLGDEVDPADANRLHTFRDGLGNGAVSDTGLLDNEPLYTNGGELAHLPPACPTSLAVHKNRLFVATTENRVVYSKKFLPGEGVETTNPKALVATPMVLTVRSESTPITGIASLGEQFLVFTEEDGYFVQGEGPNNFGEGVFTEPRLLFPGQGCKNESAIENTPVGVLYQGDRGIYQITPALKLQYIGASVEDSLTSNILSIAVLDDRHEVRLTQASGVPLVYNYAFNQWSSNTFSGMGTEVSSVVSQGVYYRLDSDGYLYKEVATYQDTHSTANNYVPVLETGWISFPKLQELARVYDVMVLGTYKSDGTLNIRVYKDYEAAPISLVTEALTTANDRPLVVRHRLPTQKCRALKVSVYFDASGEVMSFDSLAFNVGYRKGAFKLGTERTAV